MMKKKVIASIMLMIAMTTGSVHADPLPGFYYAGDGLLMGTGTGWGTEADIFRDLGLDVFELDTLLNIPPSTSQPLDAILTDRWAGQWAYHDGNILPDLLVVGVDDAWAAYCLRGARREPCPVGTIDITGFWSTDDLGGLKQNHLAVFQARQPMSDTCEVPEPHAVVLMIMGLVVVVIIVILAHKEHH